MVEKHEGVLAQTMQRFPATFWLPTYTCPKCQGFHGNKSLYRYNFETMCKSCVEETLEEEGSLVTDADNLCNGCGWGRKIYEHEGENLCIDCILERLEES